MLNKGQRQLLLIVAIFAAPVIAAVFLNSRWSDFQPEATRNRGELIEPVWPIEGAQSDRWQMVYLTPEPCNAACLARQDELARVRRALGREGEKMELTQAPGLRAVLATRFQPGSVVIIDPLGNAMMHYQPAASASDMRRDLKRLLHYSKADQ